MKLINNKNIELNIVGEGSKKNELENFSRKNNLNVNFLGYFHKIRSPILLIYLIYV